jgi:hypothetical protein
MTHGEALEVLEIFGQVPRQAAFCAYDSVRGHGGNEVDARRFGL